VNFASVDVNVDPGVGEVSVASEEANTWKVFDCVGICSDGVRARVAVSESLAEAAEMRRS
jgi:hypothetical protein